MSEMQQAFDVSATAALDRLYTSLKSEAKSLTERHGVSLEGALQTLLTRLRLYETGMYVDGRAAMWRGRVRLYDLSKSADEPIAESDPELPIEDPSATVHISLPALCAWVTDLCASYHKRVVIGFDESTLKRKMSSFRTGMSNRRDGTGIIRLRYTVGDTPHLARVDIVREGQTMAVESRQKFKLYEAKKGAETDY